MREEEICHHLHHSMHMKLQPVMGPVLVTSQRQFTNPVEGLWRGREGGGSCHRKQKKIVFSEKEWRLLLIHQDPSLCVISKLGYIMRLNLHPDAIHIPEPTTWWCSTVTNTIPTDRVSREAEKRHIKKALSKCGYLVSENKTTLLYYSVYYIL